MIPRSEFRVVLLRSGQPARKIDRLVESVDWLDDDELLRGTVNLRLPWDSNLAVSIGDQIRLDYDKLGNGNFRELWTMRVWERTKGIKDGSQSLTLANDLERLVRSEDDFRYPKNKEKWNVEKVIRDVCGRFSVTLAGALPRLDAPVVNLEKTEVSPRDIIQEALNIQEQKTGHVYIMRFEKGTLYIDAKRRNYTLKLLAPEMLDLILGWILREQFASVVTIKTGKNIPKGYDDKGHRKASAKKITVTVASAEARKRYGFVHRIVYAKNIEDEAEAKAVGQRYLAKVAKPRRTSTITQVTLPTVRRFDAVNVSVPAEDLKFDVWVISASHRLSSSGYEGTLTLQFDSPWESEVDRRVTEEEILAEVAAEKGRQATKTPPKPKSPQPPKNASRGEKSDVTLYGELTRRGGRP